MNRVFLITNIIACLLVGQALCAGFNLNVIQRQGSGAVNSAIGGQNPLTGLYYTEIIVGTPGQPFLVALDTSSANLYIPGPACSTNVTGGSACPRVDPPFRPSASTSLLQVPCNASIGVGGCNCNGAQNCVVTSQVNNGAILANIYADFVGFRSLNSTGAAIRGLSYVGVTSLQTSAYVGTQLDGVLGLAYQSIGAGNFPTPIDSINQANNLSNVFALCIYNQSGILTVGGIDPALHTNPIQYVPLATNTLYGLNISGISYDVTTPTNFNFSAYKTFIVSTAQPLIVPAEVYNATQTYIQRDCVSTNPPPYWICGAQDQTIFARQYCFSAVYESVGKYLANISLTFPTGAGTNVSMTLTWEDYFVPTGTFNNGTIPCYQYNIISGNPNTIFIGQVGLRGRYTVYDKAQNRFGFATASPSCGVTFSGTTAVDPTTTDLPAGSSSSASSPSSSSSSPSSSSGSSSSSSSTANTTRSGTTGFTTVSSTTKGSSSSASSVTSSILFALMLVFLLF